MLVSSETVERAGMQGKGVEMLHLFQDKLWYVSIGVCVCVCGGAYAVS